MSTVLAVSSTTNVAPQCTPEHDSEGVPGARTPTAVVYCEALFGLVDGKTANGLIRHSERYEVVAVIDSTKAGQDAGTVLDGRAKGIPIRRNLDDVVAQQGKEPDTFVFGIAPASGMLSPVERRVVLEALDRGLDVVSGLHEFLGDDPEFARAAARAGVEIRDVRRPRATKDLRTFTGRVGDIPCLRIAILGTDCAIGKRTTATILTRELVTAGVHAVMVGTGQTGLMQGARHGLALDAVPAQFAAGEMEAAVLEAWDDEQPEVIVIEGQGALSHPAYASSAFVLRGSQPQAVIVQHAPARRIRSDFPTFDVPPPEHEIRMIETYADTRVIGLTLNHEHMTDDELSLAIVAYESALGLPTTDAIARPPERLVAMVLNAFPTLLATHRVAVG